MSKISGFKSLVVASALVSLGLVSVLARAGSKSNSEVYVYKAADSSGYAYGALGSARNSAGSNQLLSCSVSSLTGSVSLFCSARDSAGTYVSCTSSSSRLVTAAQSLKGDSYMTMYWDSSGKCTEFYISNNSAYAPKLL